MYDKNIAQRIHKFIPNCKIIFMLRSPVDRAYSQYGLHVRNEAVKEDFRKYVASNENLIRRGLYSEQVSEYLKYFPQENIHVMIFEKVVKRATKKLAPLANFLGIDTDGFRCSEVPDKNPSYVPRFPRAKALASDIARYLRRYGYDSLVNWAKSVGVLRLFGRKGSLDPMDERVRNQLSILYQEEIDKLERLLGLDLEVWRRRNRVSISQDKMELDVDLKRVIDE
jgi:hypothetical protein